MYLNSYNTRANNILVQPFRFIVENEIKQTDIFIVSEPPASLESPWTKIIKNMIEKYSKLFKFTAIYFYELPCGYYHHQWKLDNKFLNNFNLIFSQIAAISDNNRYFWTPVNTFIENDINNIYNFTQDNLNKNKFICSDPISSGYNKRRQLTILEYAKSYDIDVFGSIFDGKTNKFKNFIAKNEVGDRGLNKVSIFKNYKFVITCENCYEYGYISERLFDIFVANSIPVYYGNDYKFLFGEDIGIINGNMFKDIHELHEYLQSIDTETYNNMVNSNIKFINNYLHLFKWDKIWHFILDKILNTNNSNKLLDDVNINLTKTNKYSKGTKILLENSEGIKKSYNF